MVTKKQERDLLTDCQFSLRLDSGADLEVLMFNEHGETEVRWIFAYRFMSQEDGDQYLVPKVLIDYRLVVTYTGGKLGDEVELDMNVIIPEKLGKKSFAGLDISPGAKTYMRFVYRKAGPKLFRLAAVAKGAGPLVELPVDGERLIKPTELPFVLLDRFERDGVYQVPFHSWNEIGYFCFPESIARYAGITGDKGNEQP